ncbi:hypothetical protein M404DRAFT_30767 [Pisolithus tinctorius Marx 270]|uniref:Uncharacterized protein n=1 Tax=Pisolithus tinctorius Marx 270 TaxID=870435 RepID=A0A0C3IQ96_PISTI|nr:hypothetical protein M404DRAFT_30767 [Pisolithus tinctorius Marx 270]
MASIARSFYDYLQQADLHPPDEHWAAMDEVLSNVDVKLPKAEKAAGLDSLPYKFWKWLATLPSPDSNETLEQETPKTFCLLECLVKVFNDIQHHRVDLATNFTEGWICPLYKKKDR